MWFSVFFCVGEHYLGEVGSWWEGGHCLWGDIFFRGEYYLGGFNEIALKNLKMPENEP